MPLNTQLDLESLRAAVLMSRKLPSALVTPNPTEAPPATLPYLGQPQTLDLQTDIQLVNSSPEQASSVNGNELGRPQTPEERKAPVVLSTATAPVVVRDKEDGEISDEGELSGAGADDNDVLNENGPQATPQRIGEKEKENHIKPEPSVRKPVTTSKKSKEEPDFSALVAEYQLQKVKTDLKQRKLQQNKNVRPSFTDVEPASAFDYTTANDPVPSPPRRRGNNPRKTRTKNTRHQHEGFQGDPRDSFFPPQQPQQTAMHPYTSAPLAMDAHSMHHTGSWAPQPPLPPPPPQNQDQQQIYALVDELLGYNVNPEQLLRMGIDSAVVNQVSIERQARLNASITGQGSTPAAVSHLNLTPPIVSPFVPPVAPYHGSLQQSLPYAPHNHPSIPPSVLTQPCLPGQHTAHQQIQELQQQQLISQLETMLTPPNQTAHAALMQLEMIMALATQILPPGWDSLLSNNSSGKGATEVTATATVPQAGTYGTLGHPLPPPTLAKPPQRTLVKTEDIDIPRHPPAANADTWGKRSRNHSAEANFTTAKFNDLSISSELSSRPPGMVQEPFKAPKMATVEHFVSHPSHDLSTQPSRPPPPPPPATPAAQPQPPPPPPREASILSKSNQKDSTPQSPEDLSGTSGSRDMTQSGGPSDDESLETRPQQTAVFTIEDEPFEEIAGGSPTTQDVADSQDDTDVDMDMDLDDGHGKPTILNRTWKTTPMKASMVTRPAVIAATHKMRDARLDMKGTHSSTNVHSAPASMPSTPTKRADPMIDHYFPSPMPRYLPNSHRRAVAMDFIPSLQPHTPFVSERALPNLIDLDDEAGDEIVDAPYSESTAASKPRFISTTSRKETTSLESIQAQVKALNNLIRAKERAKLASPSTPSASTLTPLPESNPAETLPQRRASLPLVSNSKLTTEPVSEPTVADEPMPDAPGELEQIQDTLAKHVKTLERLRSSLQQFETESDNVLLICKDEMPSDKDHQELADLEAELEAAKMKVALKARELEEARELQTAVESRVQPVRMKLLEAEKLAKDSLEARLEVIREKTRTTKAAISSVQQDIILKRTRLMMLGATPPTRAIAQPGSSAEPTPTSRSAADGLANEPTSTLEHIKRAGVLLDEDTIMTPKRQRTLAKDQLVKKLESLQKEQDLLRTVNTPKSPSANASSPHRPTVVPGGLALNVAWNKENQTPTSSPLRSFMAKATPTTPIPKVNGCAPLSVHSKILPNPHADSRVARDESTQPAIEDTQDSLNYVSPLSMFRSFRFSPHFVDTVRDGYRSLTFSHKLDPMQQMCVFELSGGSCNDDSCKSQHLRNCTLTDEELISDMARYTEGNSPEARRVFAEMQAAKLEHLRASGIHNAKLLVETIVKNHREFVQDPTRTIKFGERMAPKEEDVHAKEKAGSQAMDGQEVTS